jgi:transposase-like protein
MGQAIDEHLDRMAALDAADRRNGSYRRHLLTELGEIELTVPRTRRFAPSRYCAPMRGAPSSSIV